jgi:hypothetical protein
MSDFRSMNDVRRPRLLFLRFTRSDLPAYIRLHLQEQVACLSQFFDVTVIEGPCDYDQLCDMYQPEIAVFESGTLVGHSDVKNATAHSRIPKLGFIHCDAYCPTRGTAISDMARWEITTCFAISVAMGSYTPALADNLFVWPNFANAAIFHDYGLPKIIPVLFTGSQAIHYPWRNRINTIIAQHYPTLQSPHFGWFSEGAATRLLYGEQYARLINAAKVAPTCGTIAKEIVRKHFEIPACSTCLITERTPAVEAAGFVHLDNCIFADDVDVVDTLDWLFRNPEELDRITRAGRDLVQSRHMMRHRDQIWQWYSLHQQLKPGQRIVQLGPFLPLTIAQQSSGIRNVHVTSGGVDRALIVQGDEKLWSGHYDEAEILYRRCLNYISNLPEPRLRLALCSLHKGNPGAALEFLEPQISRVLRSHEAAEPDPIEWAYFIVALLGQGRLREAVARASQFGALRHEELDRVRAVIAALNDPPHEVQADGRHTNCRASVHQLPKRTIGTWLEDLRAILTACRQMQTVERLARSAIRIAASETTELPEQSSAVVASGPGTVRGEHNSQITGTGMPQRDFGPVRMFDRRTQVKAWLKGHVRRIALPPLQKIEARVGHFLPYKWSAMSAGEDPFTIQGLLRSEPIRSGLLIGAAAGAWLTEAFLAGMEENPNLPCSLCMNFSSPAFTRLRKRLAGRARVECRYISGESDRPEKKTEHFDVAVIDCSELGQDLGTGSAFDADLVILDDINLGLGHTLCRELLTDTTYSLIAYEPARAGGYAIFRRMIDAGIEPAMRQFDHVAEEDQ